MFFDFLLIPLQLSYSEMRNSQPPVSRTEPGSTPGIGMLFFGRLDFAGRSYNAGKGCTMLEKRPTMLLWALWVTFFLFGGRR